MIVTAATYHVPVLLKESIDGLAIQPAGVYADMTFGGGGHSREILRRLGPDGRLFAFDQDADAERNILGDDRFTFVRSNFRYVKQWMRYYGVERLDGLLADLGVSSHHVDDETRGFSFRFDAPLDMRMNRRAGLTAADIVNTYDEKRLADIFHLYGELKQARRAAAKIVRARAQQPIDTTGALLSALGMGTATAADGNGESGLAPAAKKEMAKLFQALRMEVNHEAEALREMLDGAAAVLAEGGRLVVITYHSIEDRMVKNVMKTGNAEGNVRQDFFGRVEAPFRMVSSQVIVPSEEELANNPRSRSAKLRIAMRTGHGQAVAD